MLATDRVDILSRVAEGLGPMTPQQPVPVPAVPPPPVNAGATSYLAEARRDKIVYRTALL
jgi:hypothetical protein